MVTSSAVCVLEKEGTHGGYLLLKLLLCLAIGNAICDLYVHSPTSIYVRTTSIWKTPTTIESCLKVEGGNTGSSFVLCLEKIASVSEDHSQYHK